MLCPRETPSRHAAVAPSNDRRARRVVVVAAATALLLLAGCAQKPPPAPAGGFTLGAGFGAPPVPSMKPLEIRVPVPDLMLDLKWLDLDGFFPPGARRVGPSTPLGAKLCDERRMKFPTVELCPAPDGAVVLFHDGMKRRRDIFHWLMLLKKDALYPNAIFCTKMAFDVSWAEDSHRFAVTHFIGQNSSEVFVVDVGELARRAIAVTPFLEEYFPAPMAASPVFLKAYRWTADGRLVVRALGRSHAEPYEQFGCEVLVTFPASDEYPKLAYLRGYTLPQG